MKKRLIVQWVVVGALALFFVGLLRFHYARVLSIRRILGLLALIAPLVLADLLIRTRYKSQLSRNRSIDLTLDVVFWLLLAVILLSSAQFLYHL